MSSSALSIFLVLTGLVAQACAADYTGAFYGSPEGHANNGCPAGYEEMTEAECDAVSNEIQTGNTNNAKFIEFQQLLDNGNGQATTIGSDELTRTTADNRNTDHQIPKKCSAYVQRPNMISRVGRIYYNSHATGSVSGGGHNWGYPTICKKTVVAPAHSDGDPHLKFATGGRADFRGKNNTDFALLSVRNLSLAGHIEERDFLRWNQQIVSGSFFTQAFITVRTAMTGAIVRIAMIASEYRTFRVYHDTIASVAANNTQFETHTQFSFEGVEAEMQRDRLVCRALGWKLMLIPRYLHRPILGTSIAPVGDASHWFLDTSMEPLNVNDVPGRIAPHGVIGQSFDGSGKAVDGNIDEYPDASLFVTYAQAEGAIEGLYSDYALASPFSTDFKYSRFDAVTPVAPRNVSQLTGKLAPATNGTNGAAGSFEPEDLAIEPPKLAAPLP